MENTTNLLDHHNRLIADILSRFRKLCLIASSRAGAEASDMSTMCTAGMSMDLEFEGLHKSIKELLTLSRRIKELWVFGPLGQQDDSARLRAEAVERDVQTVAGIISALEDEELKALVEGAGGTWAPDLREQEN
ncbi:hypothetical protein TD95_003403 [Thielaviopsis punctulata]|uniref:Mediator of RNA polymerase II transcription subunit 22 n=1 Tax=Thielaviopsis punctulata TaxID=72032 RepID=A0A0F4ZG15_9PEZI|nr:hypothetical protein TD95_003403 [Thielaviopsis punctulata]